MGDLIRRISDTLRRLGGQRTTPLLSERRRNPRFICSTPVLWEVGRLQGEGELREVSPTGLRLYTSRAFISGQHIRVRPLTESEAAPLSSDVAIGTIIYSRRRRGGFEVGVELINPERMSRFAWVGQLTRPQQPSPVPRAFPTEPSGRLRLVSGGGEGSFSSGLVRAEALQSIREKNSKK